MLTYHNEVVAGCQIFTNRILQKRMFRNVSGCFGMFQNVSERFGMFPRQTWMESGPACVSDRISFHLVGSISYTQTGTKLIIKIIPGNADLNNASQKIEAIKPMAFPSVFGQTGRCCSISHLVDRLLSAVFSDHMPKHQIDLS